MITDLQYSIEIRQKYETERHRKYSVFLHNPSVGNLYELCLIKYDEGLSERDRNIYAIFFRVTVEKLTRRTIEQFDTAKFRTVQYFLQGRNKNTSLSNLDLLAVLIDYENRPFGRYLALNRSSRAHKEPTVTELHAEGQPSLSNTPDGNDTANQLTQIHQDLKISGKSSGIILLVILIFSLTAISIVALNKEPQCMRWQADRYVIVDCQTDGVTDARDIEPFDKKKAALKKIQVDGNTIFFQSQQPKVWYLRSNGSIEFFNGPGRHPLSGKDLRPVSRHIVETWVLKIK